MIKGLLTTARHLWVVVCCYCASAPMAVAQTIYFNDINKQLTAEQLANLKVVLEKQVAFHSTSLKLYDPLFVPIKIFDSQAEYQRYVKANSSIRRPSGGFYSGLRREIVLYKHSRYIETLYHEAQHLVFAAGLRRIPRWLNEGLSEVYETADVRDAGVYSKIQADKADKLQQWLKAGTLPRLSSFFALSPESWEHLVTQPQEISYTLSWGVVYYLMSSAKGRDAIHKTIQHVAHEDWRYAGIIYPGGIAALEREFHAFLRDMPAEYPL